MIRRNTFVVLVLGAIGYWLWSTSRAATKTPRYALISREGPFDIRDYPPLTAAKAPMSDGMNNSFRTLFRYITGNNERHEKIAMTTPVLLDSAGGKKSMFFIMPATTASEKLPNPSDPNISITHLNASRFAVMRFPGGRGEANESKAADTLRRLLTARQLVPAGEPVIAYYDPPWTPLFLRRNEVMIPL
jgi:hypothetical protein